MKKIKAHQLQDLRLYNGCKKWNFGTIQIIALNRKTAIKKLKKILPTPLTPDYFEKIKIPATKSLFYFRGKINIDELIDNIIIINDL